MVEVVAKARGYHGMQRRICAVDCRIEPSERNPIAGRDEPLIGADNDELVCELTSPSLSSVAFAAEQGGYDAAEVLDRWLVQKKAGTSGIQVQASRVVARTSTNVLAIDDEEVVKAIRFIRENCHTVISVGDVVESTLLSQWTLNHRFRDRLGHPILKEVNRQRAGHIARLLVDTGLPIEAIARDLGYETQSAPGSLFPSGDRNDTESIP